MFDQVSWDDFVECVHTNKLFESFDTAKILYIVSRHYDTLTSPTLKEYVSAKNFSNDMSHYIKQYSDSTNYDKSTGSWYNCIKVVIHRQVQKSDNLIVVIVAQSFILWMTLQRSIITKLLLVFDVNENMIKNY